MITLYPDEKILLEKRRFWLPIAAQGIVSFIIALIPFIMIFASDIFLPSEARETLHTYHMPALFFGFVWAFFVWIMFVVRWTDYYLDVLLVTTKRVIDIEQIGLFSRDISETRLENVQDMRVEVVGFVASVLKFGNLYIQTAGSANEFAIRNVYKPDTIKEAISHQCECLSKEKNSPAPSA